MSTSWSWANPVSSLFVPLLELVVELGQRTGITDEHLPPFLSSLSGYHLRGLDAEEEEEEEEGVESGG